MPDSKRGKIGYNEIELRLGLEMLEKLEDVTDMMLYFLDRRGLHFTYIFIHACDGTFHEWLDHNKRATDLVIDIDKERGLHVVACQETDIEGGYKFAERIINLLHIEDKDTCGECTVLTVTNQGYNARQIIFRLLDTYVNMMFEKGKGKPNEITYHTL